MMKLNDKIVLVTGGNSGIGLATAQRFVAEGAYVFIVGRRRPELDRAVELIGKNVEAIQADVTVMDDLDRVFQVVKQKKGRLDVLVANAGTSEPLPLAEVTEDHYDRLFDLNTRSTLFTAQKALALMGKGSTIVLVGSIADAIGNPGYGVYGSTKAALRSFARTWTAELAARRIRVNTLSPGPIETPLWNNAGDFKKAVIGLIPLGRMGTPEEAAAAALFLASDESSFIAGIELCIDGGMTQV